MFSAYVNQAMRAAKFETLEDGTVYGEIPGLQGVWSEAETLEESRAELEGVLREWLDLRLSRELPVPAVEELA